MAGSVEFLVQTISADVDTLVAFLVSFIGVPIVMYIGVPYVRDILEGWGAGKQWRELIFGPRSKSLRD